MRFPVKRQEQMVQKSGRTAECQQHENNRTAASPMPYLILSDIHGNREALEAVLDHAQGRYDQILCLGDLVGYGADPNFAVDWARSNVAAIVRGNHDRVVSQDASLDSYRAEARD